jgi:hypothetical protein
MSRATLIALGLLLPLTATAAEPAAPAGALAKMPVKEVTVFKDGHAFVVHQGTMPTDAKGHVLLDYLPTPVFGTFWPYATDKNATLHSVIAGRRRIAVERTAIDLRGLVEANVGGDAIVTELPASNKEPSPYQATIIGFLIRSAAELESTAPPGTGELLPQKSNILLLKTPEGTKAVPFERVQDVKFIGKLKEKTTEEEFRNLLTLELAWKDGKVEKTAEVGMAYLQKGLRWIPEYRVELDGKGKAVVKLQATLINELTDLDDVAVNMVVGVPTFQFKDLTDPIAMGQTVAQLTPHFSNDAQSRFALSNSMMTQVPMNQAQFIPQPAQPPALDLGPDVAAPGKSEDLFIYRIQHVTLKKGQRMVVPVSQETVPYKDVYVLDVPVAPPVEFQGHVNDAQQAELVRLYLAPKVTHKLRLQNDGVTPFTTAPVLILEKDRVQAQGTMFYTAHGAACDITLTTAIDIKVKKNEKETKRTANAAAFNGEQYWRIDLEGSLQLTNLREGPVEIEVIRHVLGNVGDVGQDGKAIQVNLLEEDGVGWVRPPWWGWYNWPGWWYHFNGIGRFSWTVKVEPGKSVDLTYNWYYYRR